jgi:hypothetical protein
VILITILLFSVPLSAHADDPAVVKQLYDLSGRFEIILTPSMSVFDKYTRHVGTSLGVAYFLNDYIGFEVEGGYAFISNDRKLLDEILKTSTELYDPDPDKQIRKLPIHLYFVGGAGVAEYHYSELDHTRPCAEFTDFCKVDKKYDGGMHPSFYFGGGVRLHIGQHWSMRIEIRDVFFFDEYTADYKESGLDTTPKKIEDFVHNTFLRIGVGYAF